MIGRQSDAGRSAAKAASLRKRETDRDAGRDPRPPEGREGPDEFSLSLGANDLIDDGCARPQCLFDVLCLFATKPFDCARRLGGNGFRLGFIDCHVVPRSVSRSGFPLAQPIKLVKPWRCRSRRRAASDLWGL